MAQVKIKINEIDGGVDGAPGWVATFVDMISLLVTFFILLFTFASIQEYDTFAYPKNIVGTRGIMKQDGGDSMDAPQDDIMSAMDLLRGSKNPHARSADKLPESLEEMGQKLTEKHIEFEAFDVQDGMRVRFDERAAFKPGSARVNPVLRKALEEAGRTLENYQHLIVIEGYTDDRFQPTPKYPTEAALSLARAQAAAEVLTTGTALAGQTVQLAGMGNDPIPGSDNNHPLDRAKNRRIELRILSLSEQRASLIKEKAQ